MSLLLLFNGGGGAGAEAPATVVRAKAPALDRAADRLVVADRYGRSRLVGSVVVPSSGALAGSCDLVFAAGASTLGGSSGALSATHAIVFAAGATTLLGAGELFIQPNSANGAKMVFGQLNLFLPGDGALAAIAAMVFGHDAVMSSEQAFETPIVVMARSLA